MNKTEFENIAKRTFIKLLFNFFFIFFYQKQKQTKN